MAELKLGIAKALDIPVAQQRLQLQLADGDRGVEGPDSQRLWEAGVRQGMRVLVVAVAAADVGASDADQVQSISGSRRYSPQTFPRCFLAGLSLALWTVFFIVTGGRSEGAPSFYWFELIGTWLFYELLLCLGCAVHHKTYRAAQTRAWGPEAQPLWPPRLHTSVQVAFSAAVWGSLVIMATSSYCEEGRTGRCAGEAGTSSVTNYCSCNAGYFGDSCEQVGNSSACMLATCTTTTCKWQRHCNDLP